MNKPHYPRQMWDYPLPHDFTFSFGLSCDDTMAAKQSTIMPYLMQDNAIIDYETIKTNPENDDFAVVAKPNVAAGSIIPRISIYYKIFTPKLAGTENYLINFNTMKIHTAMLNRLDAFDKKTGNDSETILELTHETTDEQCYPLWNGTKLFEGHQVNDLPATVPGLTTDQQPEGVNFDKDLFFDALQYYTNRDMLKTMCDNMKSITLRAQTAGGVGKYPHLYEHSYSGKVPSICQFSNPYMFFGELFHVPLVSTIDQTGTAAETTAIEHLTVLGHVRFNEYNPDFNFSRA